MLSQILWSNLLYSACYVLCLSQLCLGDVIACVWPWPLTCMSLKGDRGPKGVPSSAPAGAEERLELLVVEHFSIFTDF